MAIFLAPLLDKVLAALLGMYPSSLTASRTLFLVASDMLPYPFRTLDTVPADTPALAATSLMLFN